MLSRIDDFRAAATEHRIPGAEVESWLEHARFFLSLPVVPEGPPPVDGPVAGRKGGLPLLPPEVPWPVGPSGPLPFHGLVHCAALPRSEQLDLHMPADGFFLFFVDFDNTMINFEDFAGTGEDWFDREQRAARLIYVPGGVPVAERPVPVVDGKPVFSAFPVVELRAVVTIDFPNGQDGHAETLGRLADKVWQGGWYGDRDIRLGGYALTPQSDPTDAIADHEHRVAGGDLEELRRQAEREWVPLAQLGSEDPVESATLARFMVKRASAVVGDFSQVLSVAEFME